MSRLVSVLMIFLLGVPAAAQPAQAPASHDGPTVVSTGEGRVRRAPDRAWVHVTAESRARSPREAQKQNAAVMSEVLAKLRATGLSSDAIQTRGYDLQPEYDYIDGKQTLRGYVARNTVEVRVDELARVGEVLEAAVASGATSVGGIRFDLKNRDEIEREALRYAVEDARRRAEAAAAGAGMKVERVLRIQEHRVADVPPPRPMMAMREAAADAAPPIEGGELEVRASVTVTAALR